jgi:hypothetical protein
MVVAGMAAVVDMVEDMAVATAAAFMAVAVMVADITAVVDTEVA